MTKLQEMLEDSLSGIEARLLGSDINHYDYEEKKKVYNTMSEDLLSTYGFRIVYDTLAEKKLERMLDNSVLDQIARFFEIFWQVGQQEERCIIKVKKPLNQLYGASHSNPEKDPTLNGIKQSLKPNERLVRIERFPLGCYRPEGYTENVIRYGFLKKILIKEYYDSSRERILLPDLKEDTINLLQRLLKNTYKVDIKE